MDKYRLVGEKKGDLSRMMEGDSLVEAGGAGALAAAEKFEEGAIEGVPEVKITQQGKPRNYISYAITLLQDKGANEIVLKAMGRAINKAVTIAEILKRKMPLHQVTYLTSSEIVDLFEPLEEGLDVVESKRYVSCMSITLSKTGAGMDSFDIGYQPPLEEEEIHPGDLNVQSQKETGSA